MPAVRHEDDAPDGPYDLAAAVTPHDTNELPFVTRGLYVGTTGNVAVVMAADGSASGAGTAVTFVGVPAGAVLRVRCRKVMSTGTTASNIVALA